MYPLFSFILLMLNSMWLLYHFHIRDLLFALSAKDRTTWTPTSPFVLQSSSKFVRNLTWSTRTANVLLLFRVRVGTEGKDVVSLARYQSVLAPTMRLGIKQVDVSHGFVREWSVLLFHHCLTGIWTNCTARRMDEWKQSVLHCRALVGVPYSGPLAGMVFWTGHRGLFLRDCNVWTDKAKVYQ